MNVMYLVFWYMISQWLEFLGENLGFFFKNFKNLQNTIRFAIIY